MFTVAFLGNRAPHSPISIQSPFKILNGTKSDLQLLPVIGAKVLMHFETYIKQL